MKYTRHDILGTVMGLHRIDPAAGSLNFTYSVQKNIKQLNHLGEEFNKHQSAVQGHTEYLDYQKAREAIPADDLEALAKHDTEHEAVIRSHELLVKFLDEWLKEKIEHDYFSIKIEHIPADLPREIFHQIHDAVAP